MFLVVLVSLGAEVVQAGPFERRLEGALEPAFDEAFRKVFLLDVLERLNRRPAKGSRPRSAPQATSAAPAPAAPATGEAKSQPQPAEPTPRGPFRRRLLRR
jgi:hypothetical protein